MNADLAKTAEHVDERFLHSALTDRIIQAFYDVYNELGPGFLESVYEKAFAKALREAGLQVLVQSPIPVWFRGELVGDFRADLVVNDLIIVELKVSQFIEQIHEAQLLNYLKATKYEVGLVLNFGARAQIRRLVFTNERKRISVHQR